MAAGLYKQPGQLPGVTDLIGGMRVTHSRERTAEEDQQIEIFRGISRYDVISQRFREE